MKKKSKTKCIGILTAGGDCPGLNAAIRAIAKSSMYYGIEVIGILDGFRGLVENRTIPLSDSAVSGIGALGGTMLGTSRDKPHKMRMGDKTLDMTDVAVSNARLHHIDCLVCLGGNGTQKNALRLKNDGGLDVMTLPKTIDNDVAETDATFGFDSALAIATEAIDRLHTTATSHHRMIVCELMGHDTGWLTLGAGIAGGADVILIPELPYDLSIVSEHIMKRRRKGKRFSIIALAEGALPAGKPDAEESSTANDDKSKKGKKKKDQQDEYMEDGVHLVQEPMASRIARQLQHMTGVEARVTSLGHVQRGGGPTARDRLLCTRLGSKAGELLAEGTYNVMVGIKNDNCVPIPLEKVAGIKRTVPEDHPWLKAARSVGTCLG